MRAGIIDTTGYLEKTDTQSWAKGMLKRAHAATAGNKTQIKKVAFYKGDELKTIDMQGSVRTSRLCQNLL